MESSDRARFWQGCRWGAAAGVAMGASTLLLMALGLWPAARPLSALVAGRLLGSDTPAHWLLLAGGAAQLSYAALCGGLLTVLSDRVTLSSALGFGLLRWFWTQVVLFPALRWGDFALLGNPWMSVATLASHATYALALGWLLREEEPGHAQLALPSRPPRDWRTIGQSR